MTSETGEPRVRPCRTPPVNSRSSRSNRMRGPRPNPRRRRASSAAISSIVIGSPAGSPSTTTARAGPCDSPAVRKRNMFLRFRCSAYRSAIPRPGRLQPSAAVPAQHDVAPQQDDERPERQEGPEREVVLPPPSAQHDQREPDHRAGEEPAEQPEHELAPPEPAEGEPEHERELHVTESHAAR